jgi:hypothetical protein
MNGIIQFNKLPWIFRFIIPTKIDVDGVKYPLSHTIDLMGVPKSYGHYRLKLIFLGFLKSRVTIIEVNQKSKLLSIIFRNENWFYYLISYSAVSFLFWSKSDFGAVLAIIFCVFILFIFIELLINFVYLKEVNSD